MDAFLKFLTADTTIFGVNIHNWMIGLAVVVVIWATVILRDL
jgi:hypothetical protein